MIQDTAEIAMEIPSTTNLLLSVLLGAIGLGYFIYGKRQAHLPALLSGLGLMIGPMFIGSWWGMLALGAGLMLLPRLLP